MEINFNYTYFLNLCFFVILIGLVIFLLFAKKLNSRFYIFSEFHSFMWKSQFFCLHRDLLNFKKKESELNSSLVLLIIACNGLPVQCLQEMVFFCVVWNKADSLMFNETALICQYHVNYKSVNITKPHTVFQLYILTKAIDGKNLKKKIEHENLIRFCFEWKTVYLKQNFYFKLTV